MKCLYCYKPLTDKEQDFHSACSKKIFGSELAPILPFTEKLMKDLALELVQTRTTIPGVQSKLSLHIQNRQNDNEPGRFTIVGLWGGYILKPPTPTYPHLPEVEDVTMHLAAIAKIKTVPHSLIRMQSGELAYITKRIDRLKKGKLHMEDMCQLTEKLTEEKYRGSYEQIAKSIVKNSNSPMLDVINFFEQLLFSFLTGNADMHLKNFSLINMPKTGYTLAPAYDMVATALVNPADDEDLALTLNGKKKKIKRHDFINALNRLNLSGKQQENIFKKMDKAFPAWMEMIDQSFLNDDMKLAYKQLIKKKCEQLRN